MFSTTEITSHEDVSDNVIHQRLFFAYAEAAKRIGGKVLEIGCGAGRGMEKIAQACESYTAIDKNDALIEQLSAQYPDFTFINSHIPPLAGVASDQFDFVISFQVIEHIENDGLFLTEIHRVLKPGGQAIITTPNIKKTLTRNPWHIREYTADQLGELLAHDFSEVEMESVWGSQKVVDYYERNKASVAKIARLDIFDLQHRLPRKLLQFPYEVLNRMNRRKLLSKNEGLVTDVTVNDYFLVADADQGFDLFCVAKK